MTAPLSLVVYAAVKPIFKIYFIIGIGYYLARKNIFNVSTCRDISDAIVTAIMPCLIFNKVVLYLKSSDIKNIGVVFFEGTLLYGVGALLGLATFYICRSPKAWFGGLILVALFPNISDLPIAYMQTLAETGSLFTTEEGNRGVAYVCIFLASQVFYQFSLGLYKLIQYDFRDELRDEEKLPEEKVEDGSESGHNHGFDSRDSTSGTESLGNTSQLHNSGDFAIQQVLEPQKSNSNSLDTGALIDSSPSHILTSNSAATTNNINNNNNLSLYETASRAAVLRTLPSQDIQDVINEYSEHDRLKAHRVRRVMSLTSECAVEKAEETENEIHPPQNRRARFLNQLRATLRNFMAPNSVSLIVSLIIAMSPPLKALFVKSTFHIPNAPDNEPPLSFVIDLTSYVGAASVPLGLLLLGATIARLKVNSIIPGFWKTVVMITMCRLVVLPIFGVGLTTGLYKAGWFGEDKLIRFISVLEFGLPNATALVYFTAFYTDPQSPVHLQMDCLALCLIAQYLVLFISLPFLVTFLLKVSLGF